MSIVIAIAVLGGLGLVFGLVLAAASKVFYVETDPRLDKLNECLPGANCGGCGYAGCGAYAEAVLNGEAPIGACASGGNECAQAMAAIMGVEAEEVTRKVAHVRCSGQRAYDKDGNPINVAKFSAVDLTTGVAGDYYLKDVNGTVTAKTILTGELNADGLIEAAPTTVTVKDFAGTLEASAWLKGKVAAKSGDIILVDSTLIDKDNLAKNYTVLVKSGNTFTVSDYASIKTVAKDQDNNIVIKTDAEGKIVLVIYTADGKAF